MILDLFQDFRDGSRLLDLLEVMSGQRLVSSPHVVPPADGSVTPPPPPPDIIPACVGRTAREAAGCFSTGATLRRPSAF